MLLEYEIRCFHILTIFENTIETTLISFNNTTLMLRNRSG